MGKATAREISKSVQEHADQGGEGSNRRTTPRFGSYTSESPQAPVPMLNRRKADPRDLYWIALGKQVRQGVGVRLTVR